MEPEVRDKLIKFFSKYRSLQFKKGEILISPHKAIKGVFLLNKGIVRCYTVSGEGVEMTVNQYRSHSLFPMNWALNNSSNRYFYEAITEGQVYLAPRKEFVGFFKKNPQIAVDLLKRIYRGLEGYLLRMESFLGGSAQQRLLVQLLIQARRSTEAKSGAISLQLSHKYLASETGLTRETVTREIKRLKGRKIIANKGNTLLIPNLTVLEKELSL